MAETTLVPSYGLHEILIHRLSYLSGLRELRWGTGSKLALCYFQDLLSRSAIGDPGLQKTWGWQRKQLGVVAKRLRLSRSRAEFC